MPPGLFITFEGIDGAEKRRKCSWLAATLILSGVNA